MPHSISLRAAAALLMLQAAASASLPIHGGATYNNQTGSGYTEAAITAKPGSSLTNDGWAIGEATARSIITADGGARMMRFSAKGWAMIPFGPPNANGYLESSARAINHSGTIVGEAGVYQQNGTSLGKRAVRITPAGVQWLEGLGTTVWGFATSSARDVNESGLAVGFAEKYEANGALRGTRPIRWASGSTAPTVMPVLSMLGSTGKGFALAVNNSGVAVGHSTRYDNGDDLGNRAVRWNADGSITELGHIGTAGTGFTDVGAIDINESGAIAGIGRKYHNLQYRGMRGVRYAPGSTTAVELSVLYGTNYDGGCDVFVRDITDSGLIVGASEAFLSSADVGTRACYWLTSGTTQAFELPNLGKSDNGVFNSQANSGNADGVLAGRSEKYVGGDLIGQRAVIWTTEGEDQVIDLNTRLPASSGWTLTEAVGISDTGFVSGVGQYDPPGNASPYQRHFTMLVPEAGTYGRGDANFDTLINFDDLLILAQHYGQSNGNQSYDVGDFDLNGAVDFDDLLTLAQHYGSNAAVIDSQILNTGFTAEWQLARSMVPEPALAFVAMVGCFTTRRRRE